MSDLQTQRYRMLNFKIKLKPNHCALSHYGVLYLLLSIFLLLDLWANYGSMINSEWRVDSELNCLILVSILGSDVLHLLKELHVMCKIRHAWKLTYYMCIALHDSLVCKIMIGNHWIPTDFMSLGKLSGLAVKTSSLECRKSWVYLEFPLISLNFYHNTWKAWCSKQCFIINWCWAKLYCSISLMKDLDCLTYETIFPMCRLPWLHVVLAFQLHEAQRIRLFAKQQLSLSLFLNVKKNNTQYKVDSYKVM